MARYRGTKFGEELVAPASRRPLISQQAPDRPRKELLLSHKYRGLNIISDVFLHNKLMMTVQVSTTLDGT